MEGSDHLFQLDEDDIFSSDSFLDELEQVEKVEHVVSKPKQVPSHHGPQQNSFRRRSNAAPTMPAKTATPVITQVKTPGGGEGKKFTFKSKTSPEIPLPPYIGSHKHKDSSVNIAHRNAVSENQNNGPVHSDIGHDGDKGRKVVVTPETGAKGNRPPPQNVTKIPSPLVNLRQLNSNRFTSGRGTLNRANELHKVSSTESDFSGVLDTSLGDFKEPPSKSSSRKSVGTLRPVGSMMQNTRPQISRQEVTGTSRSSNTTSTPGQSPGNVQKPTMRSAPHGPGAPHLQDTPRTTHKPPCTSSSSRVSAMSHEQHSNGATMNTPTCTSGSSFSERRNVQSKTQNAAQSPNTGLGCNFSPAYNTSRGGGSTMHTPQSRTGVPSRGQTPPPHGHDPRYSTPSGNRRTTPGSSVRTMHDRGTCIHTPGMGHAQRHHTPVRGHTERQHAAVAGHAQQQRTPVAGHAQRQRPHQPPPNQRQSTPGHPARPVLTPRVAQLCKGSGPSPGAGAVHGGTRKFPGPAGMLPKLSPGQKLKDAAAALKKKAEEEELSQEAEESVEEVADVGDFEHGAWFRMRTELGIKDRDPNSILQLNNIALVIRKASLKQLTKNKVNNLCVMIKTISLNSSDASVSLCDPSGEMHGTIHRRLIEEYQGDLRPGSVLVLRQVGVLSPSQRNHYLNITPSNLIQVFPGESTSRPGSQKTPKRPRNRSGKTPSRQHPPEKVSPGHRTGPPSTDESPVPDRTDGDDGELGSGDAPDVHVVAMDTDDYVEDDDAGIWEEMLQDEDEEDVLVLDSQVGDSNKRSRLDTKKEEQTAHRNATHSKTFNGVGHTKLSTSSASSSSSKPVTQQISSARRPSPTSSSTVATTALSTFTTATSTSSSSSSSSSGMLPLATKRCHPIPSKPSPSLLGKLEGMKRPCLREISGLGSNLDGGNQAAGPNKGLKPTPNSSREENIGDLLDGLEDELFDDF